MERIRLAVVTADMPYGEALCRGLVSVNRHFEISLFNRMNTAFASQDQLADFSARFDLILWDMYGEPKDVNGIFASAAGSSAAGSPGTAGPEAAGNIIFLAERPENEDGGMTCLCRYQTAGAFQRELFRIYREQTGRSPLPGNGAARVIAFFSCQGGSGCSTVCAGVCRVLSGTMGRKVLYVTLDGTGPAEDCFRPSGPAGNFGQAGLAGRTEDSVRTNGAAKGLPEYLYRLFRDPDGRIPFPQEYLARDDYGVYSFADMKGRNPLSQLTKEEMRRFLLSQIESGLFDAVLADMGNCVNDAAPAVLGIADRVCEVVREESPGRREKMLSFFRGEDAGEIEGKLLRVGNQLQEKKKTPGAQFGKGVDAVIACKAAESPGLMLEGEFGKNIHELARRLW